MRIPVFRIPYFSPKVSKIEVFHCLQLSMLLLVIKTYLKVYKQYRNTGDLAKQTSHGEQLGTCIIIP